MNKLLQCLSASLITLSLVPMLPQAVSAQQIIQLGTDTTYDNAYSPISISPWGGKNTHFQQLYLAAELNALGVTAASFIDSLAIDVFQAPEFPLPGYTVKIKNTTAGAISTFDGLGLDQVFVTGTFAPVAGQWNWLHFQSPFFWDGTSNLLIDFCFDTTASDPTVSSGKVHFTQSIAGGTAVFRSVTSQCSDYSIAESFFNRTNIKLSTRPAPDCSGMPVAPVLLPGGPFNICPSEPVTLNALSGTTGSGLAYSWQQSTDNGTTWETIAGVTGSMATFAVGTDTTQFRVQLTCNITSQTASSLPVQVNPNVSGLIYRPLPYSQDFEQWQSRCSTLELPDSNWAASPPTGDRSWRREDQGDSASWTGTVIPYSYMPVSSTGLHSARFHTCATNESGSLSVYVDCSGEGTKALRFDYMNKTYSGSAANMEILLSTDAGASFTQLGLLNSMGLNAEWQGQTFEFISTSPNTIIKFVGNGEEQWGDFDMGIDNLRILPACTGTPVAGTVDSNTACAGAGVLLSLSGTSASGGLDWLWQESTNGITWDDVTGGNQEIASATLNQATWYRCIVTCVNSGLSDTSAPRLLHLKPFYNCYCNSSSTAVSPLVNIGNVQLLTVPGNDILIDNGNPLPQTNNLEAKKHYTDYTAIGVADIIKDSTYHLDLSYMTSSGPWSWPVMSGSFTKVYIDYNHNAVFDTDEIVWEGSKPDDIYATAGDFTVSDASLTGITGMRIVTNVDGYYDSTVVSPCGPYYGGETEDYLVKIHNAPCSGSMDAGTVTTADTLLCPGYAFNLYNINYDSLSGLTHRVWQSSTDGIQWNDIDGTEDSDLWADTFADTKWFRVKGVCEATATTSYSNELKISLNAICYCVSYADGGFSGMADSSDVGGFLLNTIDHPLSGGHLNNSLAISGHTDFSSEGVTELVADSTYNFSLDHILLRNTHADAKITVFIDFNGNGSYDIPDERAFSGTATATTWHKTGTISIPATAILNTVTGMRVIINNDTAANIPSDEACGTYISGETEDYLLKFTAKTVGIDDPDYGRGRMTIFPNPSDGKVAVLYNGPRYGNAGLLVQNAIGQVLLKKDITDLETGQVIYVDLSNYAKGIYFLKITAPAGSHTAKVVLR